MKFKIAEQWCSLGMRFLKHLTQNKATYEDQVVIITFNNHFKWPNQYGQLAIVGGGGGGGGVLYTIFV